VRDVQQRLMTRSRPVPLHVVDVPRSHGTSRLLHLARRMFAVHVTAFLLAFPREFCVSEVCPLSPRECCSSLAACVEVEKAAANCGDWLVANDGLLPAAYVVGLVVYRNPDPLAWRSA